MCIGVKVSDPLELELQSVMSHRWVLGIEPGPSGRTVSVLNCWAISPAPQNYIFTPLYPSLFKS